ncbi:allophanate hydrolase [Emcibacter nanhaiensis]|uniref:Allophanate hydrolase n=1 Tax=Emcibacter nanhaiensis TaxID=1505037 RepID=A0A501P9E3_9PROT|nr:allophanate hydrolase [Emcibacter nanhaiensis]TPD56848.1 allophanate hydrolase [Emcibacter nanhaiensis]
MTIFSVNDIAERVRSGGTTAVEIARDVLERCRKYDAVQKQVWILRLDEESLCAQAARIDSRIKAGEVLPLAGVPFAVKDNIDVAGLETTAACPAFAYTPEVSAPVVERLQEAGALLVGKTNLDQFATGLVGVRSPYGAVQNAFNREYVSGGSSSGSAVAVAAGLVAFALGTDTAGSGRVPAAFNHLIGLKPTKGRWSTRGVVPACRSLDCVSVFTNDVRDAGLVDDCLNWFDEKDPFSRPAAGSPGTGAEFSFGVARDEQLQWFGDQASRQAYEKAVGHLEMLGGKKVTVDISPLSDCAAMLYRGPWVAERAAAVGDLLKNNPGAIHPAVRGAMRDGQGVNGVDTFNALYRLKEFERMAGNMWKGMDILVLPTTPTIYRISELLAEPEVLNANLGLYTNFVNLLDMSAIALPSGQRENGTGTGISLIGPAHMDRGLLEIAARFETQFGDMTRPPLDLESSGDTVVQLAVCGAHLHGMPLNWQLASRQAKLVSRTRTAPVYKMYAMEVSPPKPALIHTGAEGTSIEVEIYELSTEDFGSFVEEVPPPLAIGSVDLEGGDTVKGFVAEPRACDGAMDISRFGGWRRYMATQNA